MQSGKAVGPEGRDRLTRAGAAPASREKEYESRLLGAPTFSCGTKVAGKRSKAGGLSLQKGILTLHFDPKWIGVTKRWASVTSPGSVKCQIFWTFSRK